MKTNTRDSFFPSGSCWAMKMTTYFVRCGLHNVRTTITAKPSVVRDWIHRMRRSYNRERHYARLVVGLGVQWCPGRGPVPTATLQLCVGHKCLIFQLLHAHQCPAILRRLLVDPDVILVGLWNYRDAEMLMASEHALEVGRLVDVREVANDVKGSSRTASTGELAAEILELDGMDKDEAVGLSDWEAPQLSGEQVEYACHDVFLAFLMAIELRVWDWAGLG